MSSRYLGLYGEPTGGYYGNYSTRALSQIFEVFKDFRDFYNSCGIQTTIDAGLTEHDASSLKTFYYLLLARHANDCIYSSDEDRFKFQVMSLIYQYGPEWEAKVKLQGKLKTLIDANDENSLLEGPLSYMNHAAHPGGAISATSNGELTSINQQEASHSKKDRITAYAQAYAILDSNFTEAFLSKFDRLFNPNAMPTRALYYTEEGEDHEL